MYKIHDISLFKSLVFQFVYYYVLFILEYKVAKKSATVYVLSFGRRHSNRKVTVYRVPFVVILYFGKRSFFITIKNFQLMNVINSRKMEITIIRQGRLFATL